MVSQAKLVRKNFNIFEGGLFMKIVHVQVIPQFSGAQKLFLDLLSSINYESNDLYMIFGKIKKLNLVFWFY
ncbi:hypothetical protein CDG57_16400 [Acinetobacter junii]|nr:hypothetical protein CDG57_16400 [Acinetobacter junii]